MKNKICQCGNTYQKEWCPKCWKTVYCPLCKVKMIVKVDDSGPFTCPKCEEKKTKTLAKQKLSEKELIDALVDTHIALQKACRILINRDIWPCRHPMIEHMCVNSGHCPVGVDEKIPNIRCWIKHLTGWKKRNLRVEGLNENKS